MRKEVKILDEVLDSMNPDVYFSMKIDMPNNQYSYYKIEKNQEFLDNYFSLLELNEFVSKVNESSDNPNILDLGSGLGLEADRFRTLLPEANVFSVDISKEGALLSKRIHGLEQVQANINIPPYVSNTFEGIHCKDVLVHIPNKEVFIKNVSRILAPNGLFLVVSSKDYQKDINQFKWSPRKMKNIAKTHGLKMISNKHKSIKIDDWYPSGSKRSFMLFRKYTK